MPIFGLKKYGGRLLAAIYVVLLVVLTVLYTSLGEWNDPVFWNVVYAAAVLGVGLFLIECGHRINVNPSRSDRPWSVAQLVLYVSGSLVVLWTLFAEWPFLPDVRQEAFLVSIVLVAVALVLLVPSKAAAAVPSHKEPAGRSAA